MSRTPLYKKLLWFTCGSAKERTSMSKLSVASDSSFAPIYFASTISSSVEDATFFEKAASMPLPPPDREEITFWICLALSLMSIANRAAFFVSLILYRGDSLLVLTIRL